LSSIFIEVQPFPKEKEMRSHLQAVWMLTVVLFIFFSAGQVAAEGTAVEKKQADTTKMVLKVSPDGKSLVDQDGKEVARFAEGMQVVVPDAAVSSKMPGCMCCTNDCIIFEGGRCIKYVRYCQWDFDCNCK
jgi:hypothetical protein